MNAVRVDLFGYVVVPAIIFGLAYFPIVRYLARGLASPYAKVDLRRRFFAAAVDLSLVFTGVLFFGITRSLPFLIGAAVYAGMRDAIAGRSVGKFLFGLVVMHLEHGRPAGVMASLRRNMLFLLPGANLVAVLLESTTIVQDPQGQRLGDRLAQTQVVEGFTVRELVRASAERWLGILRPRRARRRLAA